MFSPIITAVLLYSSLLIALSGAECIHDVIQESLRKKSRTLQERDVDHLVHQNYGVDVDVKGRFLSTTFSPIRITVDDSRLRYFEFSMFMLSSCKHL